MVVAEDVGVGHISQQACLDHSLASFDQVRCTATLRADLHHSIRFPRSIEHGMAFDHIDTGRLLHVHIRPRLDRSDHLSACQ